MRSEALSMAAENWIAGRSLSVGQEAERERRDCRRDEVVADMSDEVQNLRRGEVQDGERALLDFLAVSLRIEQLSCTSCSSSMTAGVQLTRYMITLQAQSHWS
jgi:hypothetical protein